MDEAGGTGILAIVFQNNRIFAMWLPSVFKGDRWAGFLFWAWSCGRPLWAFWLVTFQHSGRAAEPIWPPWACVRQKVACRYRSRMEVSPMNSRRR